jgi:1-deoxy-D-xylulose-5-phosphate synthase
MALEAAELLEKEDYSVKVVNARFIKPLDENMLSSLLGEKMPILTIEEAVLQGGFGSSVLEYAHDQGFYGAIIDRMGIPDYFIEHGSVDELLEEIGLTTETAIKKIKMITPKKEKRA